MDKKSTANSWSCQDPPRVLVRKCTKFMVPPQLWAFFSASRYHALLASPWLPALLLVSPCPAPGDIMGDCLSYGDCQVYLALFICDHHRGSALWFGQRFRPDNGPVATSLLLEQAGSSSCPGKLCQMLSPALEVLIDTCCHFLVSECHLLTNQQVMVFGYKFGLEFSLNIDLTG